jgi:hypothetical protein
MPSYKIERWDAVIPPGHTQPLPMIYIKPDDEFIRLAQENDYNVVLTVSGTGKLYDTKPIPGVVDSSAFYPDFRPNFYNDTKLLVITLMCDYIGYPEGDTNGTVCVHGIVSGPDKIKVEVKPYEAPKPLPWNQEWYTKDAKNNLSPSQITWILLSILIVFGVMLSISFRKNSV